MITTSVANVTIIVGYNRYRTNRHTIKQALNVSLGYNSSCGSHLFPNFIWCSSGWVSQASRCAMMGAHFELEIDRENKQAKKATESGGLHQREKAMKSITTPNHNIGFSTFAAIDSTAVLQPLTAVSPNSKPTIETLQAEARFVSKHNVVPFRFLCLPFIAPL
ncbi:hypothetical protein TNCV_2828211 [Trichonephila clavipes]|nr:hypothetical protein TNCV_2828211 [Trichonephila clavipes]